MRQHFYILIFVCALTACNQKDNTLNDQQTEAISLKKSTDTFPKKDMGQLISDGWPEGLPKDTVREIQLKTYSSEIKLAILESTSKKVNHNKMNIQLLEVYRCRSWDGEKWYTAENYYSVLVTDKNSTNNSHWVVPVEYKNGKYLAGDWITK